MPLQFTPFKKCYMDSKDNENLRPKHFTISLTEYEEYNKCFLKNLIELERAISIHKYFKGEIDKIKTHYDLKESSFNTYFQNLLLDGLGEIDQNKFLLPNAIYKKLEKDLIQKSKSTLSKVNKYLNNLKIADSFSEEVQNAVDGLESFIVDSNNDKWQVNGETLYELIFQSYWNESGHNVTKMLKLAKEDHPNIRTDDSMRRNLNNYKTTFLRN